MCQPKVTACAIFEPLIVTRDDAQSADKTRDRRFPRDHTSSNGFPIVCRQQNRHTVQIKNPSGRHVFYLKRRISHTAWNDFFFKNATLFSDQRSQHEMRTYEVSVSVVSLSLTVSTGVTNQNTSPSNQEQYIYIYVDRSTYRTNPRVQHVVDKQTCELEKDGFVE